MTRDARTCLNELLAARTADSHWAASELRAVLEHQLQVPLAHEVAWVARGAARGHRAASGLPRRVLESTFAEVLSADRPDRDALSFVKEFAKEALSRDDDGVPRDVAATLYVLVAAKAASAGLAQVSSLRGARLTREVRRCLTFGWLPETVRAALRAAIPS